MNDKKGNSEESNENKAKKIQQLNILKMTYFSIVIAVIALIITLAYIKWKVIKSLDEINNTNLSEQIGDLSEFPKRANMLALISTILLIFINNYTYQSLQSTNGEERDEAVICNAWKNLMATVLFLLGTYFNYTVVNRPK